MPKRDNPFLDLEAAESDASDSDVGQEEQHEEERDEPEEEEEEEQEEDDRKRSRKGVSKGKSRRPKRVQIVDDEEEQLGGFVVGDDVVERTGRDKLDVLEAKAEALRMRERSKKKKNRPSSRPPPGLSDGDSEDEDAESSYIEDDEEGEEEDEEEGDDDEEEPDEDEEEASPQRRHGKKPKKARKLLAASSLSKPSSARASNGSGKSKAARSAHRKLTPVERIRQTAKVRQPSDPDSLRKRSAVELDTNAEDEDGGARASSKTAKGAAPSTVMDVSSWDGVVRWLRDQMNQRAAAAGLPRPAPTAPLEWHDHGQVFVVDTAALGTRVPKPSELFSGGAQTAKVRTVGESLVPLTCRGVLDGAEVTQRWDAIFRPYNRGPLFLPLVVRLNPALKSAIASASQHFASGSEDAKRALPTCGLWWMAQMALMIIRSGTTAAAQERRQLFESNPEWKKFFDDLQNTPLTRPMPVWPSAPQNLATSWLSYMMRAVGTVGTNNNMIKIPAGPEGAEHMRQFVPQQVANSWKATDAKELARVATHLGMVNRRQQQRQQQRSDADKAKGGEAEGGEEEDLDAADWMQEAEPPVVAVTSSPKAKKAKVAEPAAAAEEEPPSAKPSKPKDKKAEVHEKTKDRKAETPAKAKEKKTETHEKPKPDASGEAKDKAAAAEGAAASALDRLAEPRDQQQRSLTGWLVRPAPEPATKPAAVDADVYVGWAELRAALGPDLAGWVQRRVREGPAVAGEVPLQARKAALLEHITSRWGVKVAEYVVAASAATVAVSRFLEEHGAKDESDVRRLLPQLFVALTDGAVVQEAVAGPPASGALWTTVEFPSGSAHGQTEVDPGRDADDMRRVLMLNGARNVDTLMSTPSAAAAAAEAH